MTSVPTIQAGQEARQNALDSTILACAACGRKVVRKRRWQAFCSPKCRKAAWLLNHRTGTYTDIRNELAEIKTSLDRIEAHLGILEGRKS